MASTKSKVAGVAGVVAATGAALLAINQSPPAINQSPPTPKCSDGDIVCISWRPSPGWDDNTSYAAGTKVDYTVFRYDATRNTSVPVKTTQALEVMLTAEPRGQQCYFLSAKVDGLQSVFVPKHPGYCVLVRPKAPTDGAIEAPTDGAIEPR